ncbi:MAG: GNAT family N-acetyltransferase [Anaerolineae bacterium]
MSLDLSKLEVVDNPIEHRFEAVVGDQVAYIAYARMGDTIIYTHTEVPPAFEGKGVAGKLAQTVLDYARDQQMRVVPSCPYVKRYIERHPEYQSLVAE